MCFIFHLKKITMQYYILAIKNYANFKGRSRRKEYWMFVLFNLIFIVVAAIIDNIIGDTFRNPLTGNTMYYGFAYVIYGLVTFIPNLAVTVRRFHDIGKSGKILLVAILASILVSWGARFAAQNANFVLVPILLMFAFLAFSIWLLILLCTDSTPGPNKKGAKS